MTDGRRLIFQGRKGFILFASGMEYKPGVWSI